MQQYLAHPSDLSKGHTVIVDGRRLTMANLKGYRPRRSHVTRTAAASIKNSSRRSPDPSRPTALDRESTLE